MKEDRRVYMGKTGDMLVNRLGFTTIKDAAIAQRVASQNSVIVASIETVDVAATGVAVAEKRRTVHPQQDHPIKDLAGTHEFLPHDHEPNPHTSVLRTLSHLRHPRRHQVPRPHKITPPRNQNQHHRHSASTEYPQPHG